MTPRCLVFYISGHGFGHASRDIEVVNALHRRDPGVHLIVRTAASRWLFDLTLEAPVEFHETECDTGVVQIDSLRLDPAATVARAADFYDGWPALVQREAQFLRDVGARLVVADIPPLGCAAAHAALIPSVALSNFTWDWIYEAYLPRGAEAPAFLSMIRQAYRTARHTLRLPMCGGFAAMDPSTIADIPLVARRARRAAADTRAALGLPPDLALVLLSFGGYGLENIRAEGLDASRYGVVATDEIGIRPPEVSPARPAPGDIASRGSAPVFMIAEPALYGAGFRYEDLVAACDVVVSKPGYGIIAECAANGVALLYTSRGHFAEYDVLVEALPALVRSRFIPQADLLAGRWQPYLDALLAEPRPPAPPATNGAELAADAILGWMA